MFMCTAAYVSVSVLFRTFTSTSVQLVILCHISIYVFCIPTLCKSKEDYWQMPCAILFVF